MSKRYGIYVDPPEEPKSLLKTVFSIPRSLYDWLSEHPLRAVAYILFSIAASAIVCMLALGVNRNPASTGNLDPPGATVPASALETAVTATSAPRDTPTPAASPTPTVEPTLIPNTAQAVVRLVTCDAEVCDVPLWQDYTREVLTATVPEGTTVHVVSCYHPVTMDGDESTEGVIIKTPTAYTVEGLWCEVYTDVTIGDRIAKGMIQYWLLDFDLDEGVAG